MLTVHKNGEIIQNRNNQKKPLQNKQSNTSLNKSSNIDNFEKPAWPSHIHHNKTDQSGFIGEIKPDGNLVTERDIYTSDVIHMSNYTLLLLENWQMLYQLTLKRLINLMYGTET